MWDYLRSRILDHPSATIEVWLVLGNGLDVDMLKRVVTEEDRPPQVGPFVHLLDGLVANCYESGVRLRVFGH